MHTRNTGGLLVLLSRPGEEATSQHASNLTHTHLRVHNQRGVMLLDGVKPQTPLYALGQNNSAGYLPKPDAYILETQPTRAAATSSSEAPLVTLTLLSSGLRWCMFTLLLLTPGPATTT
jgi:hypothetical protein